MPEHPTLTRILDEWLAVGWPQMFGRAPNLDDLIVPLPPADASARTKWSELEPFRATYYSARRWHDDDLSALDWSGGRHYDLRATFITLAIEDGADKAVIREPATHAKIQRDVFEGAAALRAWESVPTLC